MPVQVSKTDVTVVSSVIQVSRAEAAQLLQVRSGTTIQSLILTNIRDLLAKQRRCQQGNQRLLWEEFFP